MASLETQLNNLLLGVTTYIGNNMKLITENTITGSLGFFLAVGSYASIFSHGNIKNFSNGDAVYLTKLSVFTSDQIFEILESLIGFIWIATGVSNFATKYNTQDTKT